VQGGNGADCRVAPALSAEERYLAKTPPDGVSVVALIDLAVWQEESWKVLQSEDKVNLVSCNVMGRLKEWMEDNTIWRVVASLLLLVMLALRYSAITEITSFFRSNACGPRLPTPAGKRSLLR
jgi:hypothetical protein